MKKTVEINYSNRIIRVLDKLENGYLVDYQKINLKLIGNRIYIPLKVCLTKDLQIEGDFLMDIGSPSGISLTSKAAASMSLPSRLDKPVMRIINQHGGTGGTAERVDFRANSITFGTSILENMVTEYSLDMSGALASDKYKGLVGNGILKRFDLVIDFPTKTLYYRPGKEYSKPSVANRLGYQYVDRSDIAGGWIVNGVYNASPAQSAGLRKGDVITLINGSPVAGISREQINALLDSSSSISLTVNRRGEKILLEYAIKELI